MNPQGTFQRTGYLSELCEFIMEPPSHPSIRIQPAPEWTELAEGVSVRHMVEGNGCSITLYRLGEGCRFDRHQHPFPELGVMLVGRGVLKVGEETRELGAGDSFFIPGGAPHGFDCGGVGPVILMNVTAPVASEADGPTSSEILRIARKTVGKTPA